jgi:redox-regulated HSP33 family molecular chaperone
MASSGMLRHVALVRTDVSEELSTSIIRVTTIGELGTTLAVTRKTPFFIVTAVKTSNLTDVVEFSFLNSAQI